MKSMLNIEIAADMSKSKLNIKAKSITIFNAGCSRRLDEADDDDDDDAGIGGGCCGAGV